MSYFGPTAPVTGNAQTSHHTMLHKTREALDKLLADQETQDSSVAALREIATRQQETLAAHQQRRGELLAALQIAQLASNKAMAGRDLAIDTPVEQERALAYEQAMAHVNAIHSDLLDLATSDAKVKEEQAGTQSILADALHNLARIVERVQVAQSLYEEELTAHREEIKAACLDRLMQTRRERTHLQEQLLLAQDAILAAQQAMAESLKEWPEYATQVLDEHLEIAPYPTSDLLDTYMHLEELIEEHAQSLVRRDPMTLKVLSTAIPTYTFAESGSRASQVAHAKATLRSPGRGIRDDLWHFDSFLAEVEQLRTLRQREHRQAVIHEMIEGQ